MKKFILPIFLLLFFTVTSAKSRTEAPAFNETKAPLLQINNEYPKLEMIDALGINPDHLNVKELKEITKLSAEYKDIKSLKGMNFSRFTDLKKLNLGYNDIKTIEDLVKRDSFGNIVAINVKFPTEANLEVKMHGNPIIDPDSNYYDPVKYYEITNTIELVFPNVYFSPGP